MPGSRHAPQAAAVSRATPAAALPGAVPLAAAAPALDGPLRRPALVAIIVLGCRVRFDAAERLSPGALARRVEMGARTYLERADARTVIVVSGGRRWGDEVEADAMARELALRGVPERAIVRERCSLSTRENARFTGEILTRRGARQAALVTCPWHMTRAVALFSRAGVVVEPVAAAGVVVAWPSRVWRWSVERVLTLA